MEVSEAMDSRTPLAALCLSQRNSEAGDVDFSKLTPSQFGISTNSFLPSSKIKDKSRVAQLKARRRSTIGVRGSPETNSLICFRAKQATKTPPRTPQLLQGSPFLSRCDSLKKKMAAFQCLMEEVEEKDEQKINEENESDKSTLAKEGKENTLITHSPPTSMTPPPSKKRCRAPLRECEDKITETPLLYPTFTTQQEQRLKCIESQSQRPHSDLDSDAKNELLSLPMLSKPDIKPADENVVSSVRKKCVRFGAPLSPEFFDKSLPPSTPLQKGGTPKYPPSSTGPKRSLLKTPQRSDPLPQPDFSSPQSNGASPVLVIDRHNAGLVYSDEVFEEIEKISFPSMEDESPSNKPSEDDKDALSAADPGQPQAEDVEVMNAAFQEEEDVPLNSQTEEKLACPTGDQPLALSVEDDQESSASSEQTLSCNSSIEPTRSRCRKRKPQLELRILQKDETRRQRLPADGTPSVPQSKIRPTVSLDTKRTNETEQMLSSIVGMACVEASVGAQDPAERRNSASKASKAKRDSGRPVRKRRSSCTDKRKELGSPAINGETGEQDAESQKPFGCTLMYQDSPVHHETECSENQETEALISCVLPNGDSMNIESLEQKTPRNKKHGPVQKTLESPRGKLVESVQSERVTDESNTGPTEPSLAPWQQADFNIDDILKPVAKSRGSVRRSLRNRRSVDLQAVGLAWVDHTSPERSKASRRKTRGRLGGVSEPLLSQASEEPAPNSPQSFVCQLAV
ncbi:cell division cycle-associated protein 2-like [Sinocyclocheilus rhinocerous]|uniref:cell division cycle-associated protein 2-like n=1 Tax=Sinocyclocheilus rhinocerous TaxID=307959 RepID=UPI0007B7A67C|nr:PREDICTED: cell division cycle-associated protein 2-like [Sinocyclocheilus rhinocerous]